MRIRKLFSYFTVYNIFITKKNEETTDVITKHVDTLAEWLRRRPAKPVGSARVGSNPTGVVFIFSNSILPGESYVGEE